MEHGSMTPRSCLHNQQEGMLVVKMKALVFLSVWFDCGLNITFVSWNLLLTGTTGRPKGVAISHNALIVQSLAKIAVIGYSSCDVSKFCSFTLIMSYEE
jgi:hypothetical protein